MAATDIPLIKLGYIDHYTMIVADAKAASDFHVKILGFEYVREQLINSGTVPEGEYDMTNHVHIIPQCEGHPIFLVITEGLNEKTVFHQYLQKHGPGIHHIAFQADDLENSFKNLQEKNITLTSDDIITDPVSGLRQVFISSKHGGYFVELIERQKTIDEEKFTSNNMSKLADTMKQYVSGK